MNRTAIPWTDYSWNVVTGCTPISPGCDNCYAQAMAHRFGWPKGVQLHPERLEEPRHLRKPRRIFVCSMSDLFHEDVPIDFVSQVIDKIWANPRHTFQLLTKRPERFPEVFERYQALRLGVPIRAEYVLPDNLWLGVTAENQEQADYRIPLLLQVPAAVRFVSCEPLLGPLDLGPYLFCEDCSGQGAIVSMGWGGPDVDECASCKGDRLARPHLGWAIAGCESGPGKRPARVEWFRDLKDQCQAAGVPFFLKQMASPVHAFIEHMPELDGQRWAQFPEASRD